jgi:hypothetical protein
MKYKYLILGILIACSATLLAGETTALIKKDSIDGWQSLNGGKWTVKNGEVYGTKDAAIKKHCILVSDKDYKNFKVTVEYNAMNGDSGFYFRLAPANNKVGFKGYHAEIRSDGKNAGGLFDVGVKWLIQPSKKLTKAAFKPGEWNIMIVEAIEGKVTVWLNGTIMAKLTDAKHLHAGKLGVQLHAGEATEVKLRNIGPGVDLLIAYF